MEREKILKSPLGKRESEVLWLTGCGLERAEVAKSLGISPYTVRNTLAHIKVKMIDSGFISENIMYPAGKSLKGTSIFMAEMAAEHGLIPSLPKGAHEIITFLKTYHSHVEG